MTYDDLCSPSAESGIIATLLHNPQYIFHAEQLQPCDFSDATNACLIWGISELAHSGVQQIDDFQLASILASNKAAENHIKRLDIKDIQSIYELSGYACRHTVEEFTALVHDVQEFKAKRELYISAQKLQQACLSGSLNADGLQGMVYNMAENHSVLSTRSKPVESFADKIDRLWMEQVDRQTGKIASIPMHIDILNEYTGLEAGELVIIGANSKVGKSAYLLSACVDLMQRDVPVLVIDSELSDRLYAVRLLANISKVPFKVVKDGTGTPEQKQAIEEAKAWIKTKKLFHEYIPSFSSSELMATFRRVNCIEKIGCLIIDYFKVTEGADAFDVSFKLSGVVNTAKNSIAGDFGIPVLSAVQCTDSGEVALSRGVKRYCSTLFTLRRKTNAEIDADGGPAFGNTYCYCGQNRNGKQMSSEDEHVSIQFDGDLCCYRNAEKQPERREPY